MMSEFVKGQIANLKRRIARATAELEAAERFYALVRPYMQADHSLRLGDAMKLAREDLEREGRHEEARSLDRGFVDFDAMIKATRRERAMRAAIKNS
jgi:hypothetical protein